MNVMPSAAKRSRLGVGIPRFSPPPYAPASPYPKSSDTIKMMFGFCCCCCAIAGMATVAIAATPAERASHRLLLIVIMYFLCCNVVVVVRSLPKTEVVVSLQAALPLDAAEADMTGRGIDRLRVARRRPVATAVVRRTEMRA